jgi:hypothetical protein
MARAELAMSRSGGIHKRPDLLYRQLSNLQIEADDTPDGLVIDAISARVIEHLDNTPVGRWDTDQWSIFKTLLGHRLKTRPPTKKTAVEEMSLEELRRLTSSDET